MPPEIVGTFERLLAFLLVTFTVAGTYAVLIGWMAAKLASDWQRQPITARTTRKAARTIRAQTITALLAGTLSLGFGVAGGLIARLAFPIGP